MVAVVNDNTDEPAIKHESHAWAVLEGDTPLFHVPGTYPPEYQRDAALEGLWRAKRGAKRGAVGVKKQMPFVSQSVHAWGKSPTMGIQSYRYAESYTMTDTIKAPFPWPGGKSDVAPAVWARLGAVDNYVEPMAGSAAMLLARPGGAHGTETVNDIDGLLINAYRAILFAPDETAEWCDWPVSEADLTSRHLYLKAHRDELTARLFADPLWCDPMSGAWWLWGAASWIGDGWCVADGPWINVDGRLVDRRVVGSDEDGVRRKMPMLTSDGMGVQAQSYRADSALAAYFARLSDRLRRVRFLCGDWRRACKDSVTVNHGLTGVFLDSPYPQKEHSMGYHSEDDTDVWFESAQWAAERGDDKRLRIAVSGYMSPACDAIFPPTWERLPWEARGGYANQSKDGRGRANAKREMIWFSPNCIDAKTDYGPLFAQLEDDHA